MCSKLGAISWLYAVLTHRGFLLRLMPGKQQMLVVQQLLLSHMYRMAHQLQLQLICTQHTMQSQTVEVTLPNT